MNLAIVGAGIMGRTLAWRLIEAGHAVMLYDRDPVDAGRAAAYTAAGMLTPYAEIESAEDSIYTMGMRSLTLWPALIASLDGEVRFHNRGSIVVSHPNDRGDLLRFHQQVRTKVQPRETQFQQLDKAQLFSLEKDLAENFNEASFFPEEAWVSTEDAMQVLAKNILASGATWHCAAEVSHVDGNTVCSGDGNASYDWVFDCRGLGAKHDWPQLRGVRGELIRLYAPDVNISRLVRMMHPRYRLYLAPQLKDHQYILGATQIESDDDSPLSVRSALELLSAVFSLNSGFAEARILENKTNCRPALPDNLPKIELHKGLVRINGLFRHGYLLAPVVAEAILLWLEGKKQYLSDFDYLIKKAA